MTIGRAKLIAAIAPLIVGCSLPLADSRQQLDNTCTTSGACGSGATCVANMCVSTQADLGGLYLKVDLPASSPYGPGTHVIDLQGQLQGLQASGYHKGLNLEVGFTTEVSGTLTLGTIPPECAYAVDSNGRIPVSLGLYPANLPAALSLTAYAAETSAKQDATTTVPTGVYDVHLKPKPGLVEGNELGCVVPPILLEAVALDPNSHSFDITQAEAPKQLLGTIDAPNLEAWTVELIDNSQGRVISTAAHPVTDSENKNSTFVIEYWAGQVDPIDTNNYDETLLEDVIVRLTAPEEMKLEGVPLMMWGLQGIDFDGDREIFLEVNDLLSAEPIDVTGSVLAATNSERVPATVYIRSEDIFGFEAFQIYETKVQTDSAGDFSVRLRPGNYSLFALPKASTSLAVSDNKFTLKNSGDLGKGKVVTVYPKSDLGATVHTPQGAAASNLSVLLTAAPDDAQTFLQKMLQFGQLGASHASTITSPLGAFLLKVDPGKFDLTIQPDASTQFPWLVRQRLAIAPTATPDDAPLGTLTIPYPVVLYGRVVTPDGAFVPEATMTAWLAQPTSAEDFSQRPAAVQIGATQTNAAGLYQLLLPASISE